MLNEKISRRTRRERLSEARRSRLRHLLVDARLTDAQTNAEFRACQWVVWTLLDATEESAGEAREERQRVRKLVEDSTGDALTVEETAAEYLACRGAILRLLDSYESSPARAQDSISFTSWISRRAGKDSQIGDLADDWLSDLADFEPTDFDRLRWHLQLRRADPEVIKVAARAWKSYSAWRQERELELKVSEAGRTASAARSVPAGGG